MMLMIFYKHTPDVPRNVFIAFLSYNTIWVDSFSENMPS
jgi:hypothetical protein